jgi:hypothetical protein
LSVNKSLGDVCPERHLKLSDPFFVVHGSGFSRVSVSQGGHRQKVPLIAKAVQERGVNEPKAIRSESKVQMTFDDAPVIISY